MDLLVDPEEAIVVQLVLQVLEVQWETQGFKEKQDNVVSLVCQECQGLLVAQVPRVIEVIQVTEDYQELESWVLQDLWDNLAYKVLKAMANLDQKAKGVLQDQPVKLDFLVDLGRSDLQVTVLFVMALLLNPTDKRTRKGLKQP